MLGLIQIYTGDGKGKTTAALGQAYRAIGHGFRVCIIQFLKGNSYCGELFTTQRLKSDIDLYQFGPDCPYASLIRQGFTNCTGCENNCFNLAKNKEEALVTMAIAFTEGVLKKNYDIVILDELNNVLDKGYLEIKDIIEMLGRRSEGTEVIITGRNMPEGLLDIADLVSEIKERRHPFKKGIPARRGIEY